ncbi:MAG TPA: hypothetical protein VMI13_00520 [Solirubrobacteraceae bacterium]|nr:hypothetical protein [Solirubrobacteraceae bacterium]
MNEAVVAGALTVAALNLAAAAIGTWVWTRGDARGRLARTFWVSLRIGQGSVLALAIALASLAAAGHHASEDLFYLYALLPLAVAFVAEQLRVLSAQAVLDQRGLASSAEVATLPDSEQQRLVVEVLRRELGVMTISAYVVAGLALRAASTAHGF